MTKARTAMAVAIMLAFALPMTMVAQSDSQAASPQGQTGEQHHMRRGPMSPQAELDHLSQALNLTDDQKAKIKPILENTNTQAQSIRQDSSLSDQDRHEKMRSLHESSMSQVRAVLTPDQQAKLDSMKQRHGKGMGHGHGMGAGSGSQQPGPPQE